MRNAITKRNIVRIHLKRPAQGRLAVRTCAEPAHARTRAGGRALARYARSGAPNSLQKPTTSNQPTQPSKMCPRSLRSLGCSRFPPMPLHKNATNPPKQDVPSLATLARVLQIPSDAPPQATNQHNQARCALARYARSGAPNSLRSPSRHSLATLARCHSAPPAFRLHS